MPKKAVSAQERMDREFLAAAAGWYKAEVFPSRFDAAAVKEINGWVEKNTHGMIDGIVEEFSDTAMLCLVNALALEAEWETIYREDQVWENRVFTAEDGRKQSATLMSSSEWSYLEDAGAQGFQKPYAGGRWAFAALLPDEGTALEDYLNPLTGARLRQVLAGVVPACDFQDDGFLAGFCHCQRHHTAPSLG